MEDNIKEMDRGVNKLGGLKRRKATEGENEQQMARAAKLSEKDILER